MNRSRRGFLAAVVSAPLLTVAAVRTGAARVCAAPPLPEFVELGDLLALAAAPTNALLAVITVGADGRVTLQLPRAEVGQGITTVGAQLVAEELDLPIERITVELAPARPELLFNQLTGSSNSVRALYDPVRWSAATVRARLVAAASARLGADPAALRTAQGWVLGPGERRLSYGELSAAAADPALFGVVAAPKPPAGHAVIGRPQPRIDARAIVTGRHEYAMDLRVPEALPVLMVRPPTINGTVQAADLARLRAVPGVVDAAVLPTGVAICARTFGQALAAKEAAQVRWRAGTADDQNDDTIRAALRNTALPLVIPRLQDFVPATTTLDLEFDFAFVAHAPMETNCAVADVRSGRAEIWAPLQSPIVAHAAIAAELLMSPTAVRVHVTPGGGSFGRRLFYDAALEAAQASRAFGRPVRLMWTRIDDMRHGRARPATFHRLRANIGGGRVLSYEQRIAAVETDFGHGMGEILTALATRVPYLGNMSFAQAVFQTSTTTPYEFGAVTYALNEAPLKMHTGSWRSVYSANTRLCEEVLADEIAYTVGEDPLEFRRRTVKSARARRVLDEVAHLSGWGRDTGARVALGVSVHEEFRSVIACVVELDATEPDEPRVTKAYFAVDVGLAVNPLGLEAQLLGGLTDAIATVLSAGLHIDRGLPLEGSFSQFRYARQRHSPRVFEVSILNSGGEPGGAGELAVPVAAGAIACALIRATGNPVRRFPFRSDVGSVIFPRTN